MCCLTNLFYFLDALTRKVDEGSRLVDVVYLDRPIGLAFDKIPHKSHTLKVDGGTWYRFYGGLLDWQLAR